MKLGDDTVGIRKVQPGVGVDEFGEPVTVTVDVEVPWCLMAPTQLGTRFVSAGPEPLNRTGPMTSGYTLLADPAAGVEFADAVIWPITGRETVDGQLRLSGREWRVTGEPGRWEESTEVTLRAAT